MDEDGNPALIPNCTAINSINDVTVVWLLNEHQIRVVYKDGISFYDQQVYTVDYYHIKMDTETKVIIKKDGLGLSCWIHITDWSQIR